MISQAAPKVIEMMGGGCVIDGETVIHYAEDTSVLRGAGADAQYGRLWSLI